MNLHDRPDLSFPRLLVGTAEKMAADISLGSPYFTQSTISNGILYTKNFCNIYGGSKVHSYKNIYHNVAKITYILTLLFLPAYYYFS